MPHENEISVSLLSAEWINARMDSVLDRMQGLFDRIIDEGILSSGYFPFEEPLDASLLPKMTEKQINDVFNLVSGEGVAEATVPGGQPPIPPPNLTTSVS